MIVRIEKSPAYRRALNYTLVIDGQSMRLITYF